MRNTRIHAWQLGLLAAAWIVAVDNRQMFVELFDGLDLSALAGWLVLSTLLLLQLGLLLGLIMLVSAGRYVRVAVTVVLVLSAFLGFFVDDAGVVFNTGMMNNIADTIHERNAGEAMELLSWPLLRHVLLFGLVPALFVTRLRIKPSNLPRNLGAVLACLLLATGAGLVDHSSLVLFAAEHRDLRYYMTPLYPIAQGVEFVADTFDNEPTYRSVGLDARKRAGSTRPTIGIMVVGETARADRFSLNGYERSTNPLLAQIDGLRFTEAGACGTSTAYSVPCMFFLRGHSSYSPDIARRESNVLDVLEQAGVKTVWIDNNSSCKHVCDRIETINLRRREDGSMLAEGDYDTAVVPAASAMLDQETGDALVVIHLMGSHGPAYSRRYPGRFDVFRPACEESTPMECSEDELSNAYDNTIVFTDFVLSQLIELLRSRDDADTFLLYASDHGESLGENGVFLHGLPIRMAPPEQTRIPLILWQSPDYEDALTHGAKGAGFMKGPTHDVIPHTLLGLYGIASDVYRRDLDLSAGTSDGSNTVQSD